MVHKPTHRVISILQEISDESEGYTLSELTKRTGIPVGTISPILKTLLSYKFLELNPGTNKYTTGVNLFYIGSSFVSRNTALELVREEMHLLSAACKETCQFGILKGGQVFYLIKVEGKESIRIVSEVGGALPAYATALGKAILSNYSDEELEAMYGDGMKALTPNTVTDLPELIEQLHGVKKTGFALENEESNDQICCIGVPINQNNKVVAGLSVVFPVFRKTVEKEEEIKALLIRHKRNIEKILINYNLTAG